MKGYITGAGSALVAMPLAAEHPALFVLVTVSVCVIVLAFWTGFMRVEWRP